MRTASAALFLFVSVFATQAQDVPGQRPRTDLRRHTASVYALSFSPDGKLLASTGNEGDIKLWDLATQKVIREYRPHGRSVSDPGSLRAAERRVEGLSFSPSGALIGEAAAEGPTKGSVRLWSSAGDADPRLINADARNVRDVLFTPDGKLMAVSMRDAASASHKIVFYDIESGKAAFELNDHRLAASALAISPDGKRLATAGGTKLLIWDLTARKVLHEITGNKKSVTSIAFAPDGKALACATAEDVVRLWNVEDGRMTREIKLEQDGVNGVAFSPSGKTIATAGSDQSVKLWNPETGRRYKTFWGHAGKVLCAAFSPDGKTLATGGRDGVIALWDIDESTHKDQKDEPADKEKDRERESPKKP